MPDFQLTPRASLTLGNTCTTCSTHAHADGFVDLLRDFPAHGRLAMCAGCVRQAAKLVGCHMPEQVAVAREEFEKMDAEISELIRERDEAVATRVVPMAEVLAYLKKQPPKPKP